MMYLFYRTGRNTLLRNGILIYICIVGSFLFEKDKNDTVAVLLPSHKDSSINNTTQYFNQFFSPTHDIAISLNKNRPVLPESLISSNNHFVVHFTREGKDAVTPLDTNTNRIPDWIEIIADAFEKSYEVEINQLGYRLPPSFKNGTKFYDVYVLDLTNNYAITMSEDVDSTALEQKKVSSYILFDNDFVGPGYHSYGDSAIKVTAAHEFFHAIQLGYIFRKSDGFFFELTAVWMEDQVFDEIDNYLYYFDYFFSAPDIPLNGVSYTIRNIFNHMYGSAIFAFFLSENFGVDIIRQIWELMPDKNALEAVDYVLRRYGSNFESQFLQFSLWNFFTGDRAKPDYFYKNGEIYPEIQIEKDMLIDYYADQNGKGYFLTASYYIFHPVENGEYKATLSTDQTDHWRLAVAVFDENAVSSYFSKSDKSIELGDMTKDQTIVVIPCNVDRITNPSHVYFKDEPESYSFYIYKERKAAPTVVKSFQIQNAYPNPFSRQVTFVVKKISDSPLSIRVFNIRGQQVNQFEVNELSQELNHINWQISPNKNLPPGIYFFKFAAGDFFETTKVILCR